MIVPRGAEGAKAENWPDGANESTRIATTPVGRLVAELIGARRRHDHEAEGRALEELRRRHGVRLDSMAPAESPAGEGVAS
ncbi:hypothetical protein Mal64_37820 [Pseudobythopirellula maris]|uniref:Uncharacterized protein n=1 Tax=Pseudobythopirellula maris TaxID=2527991 RepID=A0A5C5ZI71_9BACT|nr:hypothetical protein [Pseudobythopirellula maris]TWT86243.1 hypothetical protein Mal64_37820 [Pseudobythopirellula maris]